MGNEQVARTVFVVDDDADVLASLRFLLEAEGLQVETFESGQALLLSRLPGPGDCLVIDYKMTGMNGLELVHRLRDRQVSAPVILITVYEGIAPKATASGIRHVVLKPHIEESLVAYVHAAMRGGEPPDQPLGKGA